jgi:transcriptional regulator with XRE-family HTH domain
MTQDQLAQKLRQLDPARLSRTSEKYVSQWENGPPRIAFSFVDALAAATSLPLEFFAETSSTPRDARSGRVVGPLLAEEVRALQRAADDLVRRLEEAGGASR